MRARAASSATAASSASRLVDLAIDLSRADAEPVFAPNTRAPLVDSEHGRLTRVLLGAPDHLAVVPCNSVSRESIRNGLSACADTARRQHAALARALESEGVRVELAPAKPNLPDLAFTRDTSLMTPWGLVGLKPGAWHRSAEVDVVLDAAERAGLPILGRIERGTVEGGDVALVKPGLVVIGVSGGRTDEAGAEALAAIFRARGWRAWIHAFDPHFLHLDTIFCMAGPGLALACTDVLDDDFVDDVRAEGIEVLPVTYKEARRLGCNVLSLGDRRVLTTSSNERVNRELARRGYRPIPLDLSQFTQCGGGVHCLTMPLERRPG